MDKARAAAKQARALESVAEQLAAIEARLAPQELSAAELVETEPMATAAQVEALAALIESIKQGLIDLAAMAANRLTAIETKLDAALPAPAPRPQNQQRQR